MSVVFTVLSLLAVVVLTAGTALFVSAEFSLTALERSTVDANARSGRRRDRLVQRAHRTLSTQLSGAQIGISITTLITGFLGFSGVSSATATISKVLFAIALVIFLIFIVLALMAGSAVV